MSMTSLPVQLRTASLLAFAAACWPAAPPGVDESEASSSAIDASACFNGTRDGRETDIDCGGSACAGCFGDALCDGHDDCATGNCEAGRCEYLASCRELQLSTPAQDGVFWVDFDADGPQPPAQVLCDQTDDGGGWMLVLKVHRAEHDGASESRIALRDGFNPHLLLDTATTFDRGVASHGTVALGHAITDESWARITLIAGANEQQTATWFKRIASAASLSRWFFDDEDRSPVCSTPEVGPGCTDGVVAKVGDVTRLGGLHLSRHDYTATGDLELRLEAADELADAFAHFSGVCSMTLDHDGNAWRDTHGGGSHWGNGLLVWIR